MNPNQPIFDAITAATRIENDYGGQSTQAIIIDVKKFIEVFNSHRDYKLCTSLSAPVAWREALSEIAMQKTSNEIDAEGKVNTSECDFMVAYDTIILIARRALASHPPASAGMREALLLARAALDNPASPTSRERAFEAIARALTPSGEMK